MPPSLAVIVVTHNTRAPALLLLDSLAADPRHVAWEVHVIDNDSADDTAAAVSRAHPWARVTRNSPQRGFAAAVNQGVAMTTAPFVAALNPDTIVPPGTLGRLLEILARDPSLAAVGPLIRFPDGRPQRQGQFRPRPLTALVVLLGLANAPLFRREARRYYGSHEPGSPRQVELLPGTCLVFQREAFVRLSGFDERFFVYCEDVDWCIRAGEAGWKLLYVPEVEITHEKAAASRTRSAWTIRTYYRSVRAFYAKHHGPSTPAVIRGLWYAGAYAKEWVALAANALRREQGLRY